MYSMVLMAALTTGTDMPDWGRGGWGCCGCYGGYAGCYGYGRGFGGYGYGWGGGYGGWGGGYGGWGGYGRWGGGYGGWAGGWGGPYAGGYGGFVYTPTISSYAPVIASNTLSNQSPTTRSMYYSPGAASDATAATIIVHLPAKARLIVDGQATRSTSDIRRFVSPPLKPGESYHYIFKAEMDRGGQTMTTTKRVHVAAGNVENVYLSFANLDQNVERNPPAIKPDERKGIPEKRKLDRP